MVYLEQLDGDASVASISQDGQDNVTELFQEGVGNQYTGIQSGDGNTAYVEQSGGAFAETDQTGSGNRLTLTQDGFPYGASASISQTGTNNQATVEQPSAVRYSSGSVELEQIGPDNVANVTAFVGDGYFAFTQDGVGNELTAEQGGRDSSVEGRSTGDYNRVDIRQDFDGNSVAIDQNGTSNEIDVVQEGYYSNGVIEQTSTENYASLVQTGGLDSVSQYDAVIMQNGTGNSAFVTQGP
ncbi:hypothetical protein [Pseudomonas sp. DNDY-54]|uniref:hypothetical protein n=1 Tax=Pseudomonas sp. DNDY-54 TaxID=2870860 RepID=UPI001CA466CB|nr:hypothetical protein [Pseudomonas sp. DNDY-54]